MYSRTLSLFVALACTAFVNSAPIGGGALLDVIPAGVLGQATPKVASHLPGVLTRADVDSITGLIPSQLDDTASGVHLPSIPRSIVDDVIDNAHVPVNVPVDVETKDTNLLRRLDGTHAGPLVGLIPGNVEETAGELISADTLANLPFEDVPLSNRDEEHSSLPEIFKSLVVKISPVADQLKAAVSVKADVSAEVVVGLLNEVIVILTEALEDVQYIVDNPTGFVLSVAGTILSIKEVAFIVSTLLTVVIPLLFTVVAAVEGAAADLVLPLVATIGSLVASLLSLALALVPGLLALLFPLVASLVSTIYYLRLADVVAILGLPALA